MPEKKRVVIGLLGSQLDAGKGPERWERWRPTVSLCMQENLIIDRLELLHQPKFATLAQLVGNDVRSISPETALNLVQIDYADAWDFEQVYGSLHDFAHGYSFDTDSEEYLIHITTGTHVAQICMFLLTESRRLPGQLVQTAPPGGRRGTGPGTFEIIDLNLSRYDKIARRFETERRDAASFLKSGIETRNAAFNALIDRIEKVAGSSSDPMLLMGPTGAGKSRLARRIYELKRARHQVTGEFVDVNCATLRGDAAMSALFGHTRGAFTGAVQARPGLLKTAHMGILFLDEIGALGLDEQAMLLKAIEEKSFLPLGADRETKSEFQLIAGTNSNLMTGVATGKFREDLLARINLWTFELPGLKQRHEDVEPNLQYELEEYGRRTSRRFTFNKEAHLQFLTFAASAAGLWTGNFRDLNGAVIRMATLAPGGRITSEIVSEEIDRLTLVWDRAAKSEPELADVIDEQMLGGLDLFDRMQLSSVIHICRKSHSLSEAGRALFAVSREKKATANDADRLRKYLARFGLDFSRLMEPR